MSDRPAKRIMLIGWDAADWQIIRPLLERGGMPNFRKFVDHGTTGNINTLSPVLSPILWNSIATGKTADKHDILGFMEPDGEGFVRPVSSTSRKAKAIWNILSQNDMKSVVVGWFASYPAEKINGAVVTDRYESFTGSREKFVADTSNFHPEALQEVLDQMHLTKESLSVDMLKPLIPHIESIDTSTDPLPGIAAHMLAQCANVHNAATYLVENEDWDLAALYYTAIDHFGHAFQEFHPPQMDHVSDEQYRLYQNVISSVYQYHDMMLGRLMELAGEDTTVIILSDHGFRNGTDRPKIFVDPKTGNRTGPGTQPVPWHRQFGVLAALGPGIAEGQTIRGASLLDVCPTILTLLGLPVGQDMDGRVLEPLFASPPDVKTVPSHEEPHPNDGVHRGEQITDPYAAQEALKQLAELGYVDPVGEDKELAAKRTSRDRRDSLATVLFNAGKINAAAELLRELLDEFGEPYFRYRLCTVLAALKRYDEVTKLIDESEASAETANMMTMMRGQLALAADKPDEAIEHFETVLKNTPGMPRIRALLARPLMRYERWDDAERVLGEAFEINPEDTEALNLLGVLFTRTDRHEKAVEAFMRSVTLEHGQPQVHTNLGMSLLQSKQWDWAIRAFENTLEMTPDNPLANRMLAKIYREVKQDEAKANMYLRAAHAGKTATNRRMSEAAFDPHAEAELADAAERH